MRFTLSIKGPKGRPKIWRTNSVQLAWARFTEYARAMPETTVTLHDELTDVEVSSSGATTRRGGRATSTWSTPGCPSTSKPTPARWVLPW